TVRRASRRGTWRTDFLEARKRRSVVTGLWSLVRLEQPGTRNQRPETSFDVREKPTRHPEEPSARRLDRELAPRHLESRRKRDARRGQADRVLRPDFQGRVEVEA